MQMLDTLATFIARIGNDTEPLLIDLQLFRQLRNHVNHDMGNQVFIH